jgi:cytoplasmic tRNA 2-thiolation protein 1
MRGDIARLARCTDIVTKGEDSIRRSKPFKYAYEKEIVMYAYFKRLDYFSTECIYSPDAYRGHARTFLKDLEAIRPSSIIDIIKSGETFVLGGEVKKGMKAQQTCLRCGYISSNDLCVRTLPSYHGYHPPLSLVLTHHTLTFSTLQKACALLEGLEAGLEHKALKASQADTGVKEGHRTIPFFERRPAKSLAAAAAAQPDVAVEIAGVSDLVEGVEGMGFGARHEVVS